MVIFMQSNPYQPYLFSDFKEEKEESKLGKDILDFLRDTAADVSAYFTINPDLFVMYTADSLQPYARALANQLTIRLNSEILSDELRIKDYKITRPTKKQADGKSIILIDENQSLKDSLKDYYRLMKEKFDIKGMLYISRVPEIVTMRYNGTSV